MPRRRTNPLALAVLACLSERPMHPYEMAATMRTRGQDASIRLNYGSLYGVVETLLKRGLVEEQEVVREGRRPERTVYRITDDGRAELEDWMAQLLGRAAKEFPQFEAGLSLMGVLPPERVVGLLQDRVAELQARLSELDAIVDAATHNGVPRVFLVEMDYERALVDADCAFTEQLAASIESESLDGVSFWKDRATKGSRSHELDRRSRRHRPLVRGHPGVVRGRPVGAGGWGGRPPRAERRRQDHPRPDPLDPARARRRLRRASPGSTWSRSPPRYAGASVSPASTRRSTRR